MPLLFEQTPNFSGLPESGFEVFSIEDREARRHAIIDTFHPCLKTLGEDLLSRLSPPEEERDPEETPLHIHLPRLDWPRGYQPFCTWLAISREAHGYQTGPQLNVGVHACKPGDRRAHVQYAEGEGQGDPQPAAQDVAADGEKHDITFHYIPVFRGLTMDVVEQFRDAVDGSDGPLLAYCRSGQRSAVIWQASGSP